MDIGIITDSYAPKVGGIETYTTQLCQMLADREIVRSVSILAFVDGPDEELNNIRIRRVKSSSTVEKLYVSLKWYLKLNNIDIIHCTTFYPAGLCACVIKYINSGIPVYITGHGTECILSSWWRIKIRKKIIRSANGVFTLSKYTKKKVREIYDTDRVKQVYPGVNETNRDISNSQIKKKRDRFLRVIFVGRLTHRKRVIDIIDAIRMTERCKLWVVGKGKRMSILREYVSKKELGDRVRFCGYVSNEKLENLYCSSDVFCMPSIYRKGRGDVEGLGLVFIESQARGLPVIGTDSGGIPETFEHNATGKLVNEKSPHEIADALEFFRDNPEELRAYSKRAIQLTSKKFNWRNMINEYLSVYAEK